MRFFPWNNTDPDAAAYIAAVEAAGGTVSGARATAINAFYKTGKADGWYSSLKRSYLPIWGVAAPNAICMTSLTSGTFVGTVTHAAGFVNGDGATGHFISGVTPSALGCTTSSGSIFTLTTGAGQITGNTTLHRTEDSSNTRFAIAGNAGANVRSTSVFSNVLVTYPESDSRGIILASRTSTLTSSSYKRVSSGFTTTANESVSLVGAVGTVTPITFMATNINGVVTGITASTIRFGSYGAGIGFTSAEATNFTLALKNLWEGCTNLTLP